MHCGRNLVSYSNPREGKAVNLTHTNYFNDAPEGQRQHNSTEDDDTLRFDERCELCRYIKGEWEELSK